MRLNKKNELDVDFIGGQEPLTKEEEKAISDYINAKKAKPKQLPIAQKEPTKKKRRLSALKKKHHTA